MSGPPKSNKTLYRVIFLDVDGVLNSLQFFYKLEAEGKAWMGLVDPKAVERLSRLVRESGAELILSSSWREGWDPDPDRTEAPLQFLNDMLGQYDMRISDKTPAFHTGKREDEIIYWLRHSKKRVDSFVILDDAQYGWKRHHLERRWVQTDFQDEGLREDHVEQALKILNKKMGFLERLRCRYGNQTGFGII